ncbi:MAG TPA: D-glycero-beta-D-manno-heptose 1-phosphate adenylyltransferase [Candidatus Kapabacteria bacterium]|nr:D-glycero-beta-D-manno-heptose 1-phosphate adenylyltransferase [Candidatus Kapabacteria bacterium]
MNSIDFAPIFEFRNTTSRGALQTWRERLRETGKTLVFTNGVFDLLHAGHASYLREARNAGDALIIGLNSDASVRAIKGPNRPIQKEADRALVLSSLKCTDAVVIFEEETPLEILRFLLPDILIKGADYSKETIVGADVVEANGGQVLTIPLSEGRSTSGIVERILERYK